MPARVITRRTSMGGVTGPPRTPIPPSMMEAARKRVRSLDVVPEEQPEEKIKSPLQSKSPLNAMPTTGPLKLAKMTENNWKIVQKEDTRQETPSSVPKKRGRKSKSKENDDKENKGTAAAAPNSKVNMEARVVLQRTPAKELQQFLNVDGRSRENSRRKGKALEAILVSSDSDEAEENFSRRCVSPFVPLMEEPKIYTLGSEKAVRRSNRKSSSIYRRIMVEDSDSNYSEEEDDIEDDEYEEDPSPVVKKRRSVIKTPASGKKGFASAAAKRVLSSRKKMTPGVPDRSCVSKVSSVSPLQEAQARLHVSAVPDSLPCREEEFGEVYAFAESKIRERGAGCMYISGVPGTGKTATVREVIRALKEMVDAGDLEDFTFVEINGMRLTEPGQAYVQIWRQLTGQKATAAHSHDLLQKKFSEANKKTTVLLVDELDMLWNKKQTILYNIFDWPTNSHSRLVVLTIANTMDLPEKMMMSRVSSRLGLTRLQFAPYTHQQLQEIVVARLSGLKVFDSDAVQLVARKVASLSGDARRALDICRRATEIAQRSENGCKGALVGMQHVTKAHEEMFSSLRVTAVRNCSKYEKLFLKSVVDCFRRTGVEETYFDRVYSNFLDYLSYYKLESVNSTHAYELCMDLAASRLILAETGKMGPQLRIWLNVSQEDVLFALES